jgi:hypothetical protein
MLSRQSQRNLEEQVFHRVEESTGANIERRKPVAFVVGQKEEKLE